jgi:large subunit ribosomal protein L9
MEIILKQDIQNLGDKDDILNVKDGYARNYLIPKGLAINATASAKKVHQEILKQRAHKEEKVKKEAQVVAEKLKTVSLTIGAKTSTKGKIFGSVNTIQLSEALKEKGFDIDRRIITIKEDLIKEIGKYTAKVRLHKEVQVEVPFEIIAE